MKTLKEIHGIKLLKTFLSHPLELVFLCGAGCLVLPQYLTYVNPSRVKKIDTKRKRSKQLQANLVSHLLDDTQ